MENEHSSAVELRRARAEWTQHYGIASTQLLCGLLEQQLSDLGGEVAVNELKRAVELNHRETYGELALRREFDGDVLRDRARTDDVALLEYDRIWRCKLEKLHRLYPERWSVPGWSWEELRDALRLRLVEMLRDDSADDPCRPGKEWGFLVVCQYLKTLRRSNRLHADCVDFLDCEPMLTEPDLEERWLALEQEWIRNESTVEAERRLSAPERRWYAALRLAARSEHIFESSQELNLSAASRNLGRHRSSALRAYRNLQEHFQRQLLRNS